jgi:uncharacterized protein (TIGR00645 family)
MSDDVKGGASKRRGENFELRLERGIFATRWLLAPVYVGLVVGLGVVVVTFFVSLWNIIAALDFSLGGADGLPDTATTPEDVTVAILSLVDIALIGNLILIVIFAGYENFVSRLSIADEHVDKPAWMGHVDFSGLKMKLIGSLVAISAILLLKDFVNAGDPNKHVDYHAVGWQIGIHLTFVFSGLIFAIMDYWGAKRLKVLAELHSSDAAIAEPFDPDAA